MLSPAGYLCALLHGNTVLRVAPPSSDGQVLVAAGLMGQSRAPQCQDEPIPSYRLASHWLRRISFLLEMRETPSTFRPSNRARECKITWAVDSILSPGWLWTKPEIEKTGLTHCHSMSKSCHRFWNISTLSDFPNVYLFWVFPIHIFRIFLFFGGSLFLIKAHLWLPWIIRNKNNIEKKLQCT